MDTELLQAVSDIELDDVISFLGQLTVVVVVSSIFGAITSVGILLMARLDRHGVIRRFVSKIGHVFFFLMRYERIFDIAFTSFLWLSIITFVAGIVFFLLFGIFSWVEFESYLPLVAIVLVILSVVMSVLHAPKKLLVAAGASLAFIGAAYAYEIFEWSKTSIEDVVREST